MDLQQQHPGSKTKTIRGRRYMTIPFGARTQLKFLPDVLSLIAGPFGAAVESFKNLDPAAFKDAVEKKRAGKKVGAEDLDVMALLGGIDGAAIREGVLSLAQQLEEHGPNGPDDQGLILELLGNTYAMKGRKRTDGIESCRDDFDQVFQSDFLSLFQVLAWVVQVNYAPFSDSGSDG